MADAPVTPGPTVSPAPEASMLLAGGPVPAVAAPNMGGNQPPDVGTPPPANVQPADQPGVTTTTQGPSYQPDQTQAPEGVSGDPVMQAAAIHHGRIGRAIDAVTKALGGSRAMHVVQMPDGSYVAQEMDTSPAERWSRIAKAALSGAAAGFAGGRGYGGGAGAFTAGAQTGLSMPQQMQDQTMQKAQDLEAQREKSITFKKNMAMLDLQTAQANLNLLQQPVEFAAKMAQYGDARRKAATDAHGKLLATYGSLKELNDHMQTNDELMKKHVGDGGTLVQIPKYGADGTVQGVDVYGIPEDVMNQYIDSDQQVLLKHISPDGKSMQTDVRNYAKGKATWREVLNDQKSQDPLNATADLNFAKLQDAQKKTDIEQQNANREATESKARIAHLYAETAKINDELKTGGEKEVLTGQINPKTGMPMVIDKHGRLSDATSPEGVTPIAKTSYDQFKTKTLAPAIKGEEAYNAMVRMDDDVQHGKINPIEQRTQMRMAMQIAAGLSPTTGTGGKGGMSSKDFNDALAAQGIVDKKVRLIDSFLNGTQITKKQSKDILNTMGIYRQALWRNAAQQGVMNGMAPEDIVPKAMPNRQQILDDNFAPPQPQPQGPQAQQQQVQAIPQPKNATQRVPGSDGNWHWSDGKQDLGIAGKM